MNEIKDMSKLIKTENTKYINAYPNLLRNAIINGDKIQEICDSWQISSFTFYRWLEIHPEMLKAYQQGLTVVDAQVTESLLKNATGYEYTETTVKESGEGGQTSKEVITYHKHRPGDTSAQRFWLSNRRPRAWGEKKEITVSKSLESFLQAEGLEDAEEVEVIEEQEQEQEE